MRDIDIEADNALDVLAVLTESRPGNVRLTALGTLTSALKQARADARKLEAALKVVEAARADGHIALVDALEQFDAATKG